MPTAEKAEVIDQAKAWYDKSIGVVFTDYRGLSVKDMQGLRADLRKKGGELHVLKNTLFRIAVGDKIADLPEDLHNGTTAFAFVNENESDVSKVLVDYARTSKKLVVKGGYFAGKAFTSKEVEALSALPPRDVLIAQVIGAIAAPLTTLIATIEALYADPIRVIGAVADKVAESSPAPKAEAASAPVAAAPPPVVEDPAATETQPTVEVAEASVEEVSPEPEAAASEPEAAPEPEAEAPAE